MSVHAYIMHVKVCVRRCGDVKYMYFTCHDNYAPAGTLLSARM